PSENCTRAVSSIDRGSGILAPMSHPIGRRFPVLLAACLLSLASSNLGRAQNAASPTADPFAIPATDDGLPGAGPIRRYDWFQQLWRERRSAWARDRARDEGAVVFLGDSITQLWGDALPTAFAGVKIANRGISGDTTRGGLVRRQDDGLVVNPKAGGVLLGK